MTFHKYDITERGYSICDIFRGKTIDANEWTVGVFSVSDEKCYIAPDKKAEPIEVKPDTVGMCMMREIGVYEDDVIRDKVSGKEGIVIFSTVSPSGLIYMKKDGIFHHFYEFPDFEVLGNIHDDPKLLEKIGKSYKDLHIW